MKTIYATTAVFSDALPAIVERYVIARDLCEKHRDRLRMHVERYRDWHNQRPGLPRGETDSDRLNAWLASLADFHKPATVNGYRQSIVTLLRFATPDGAPLPRADRIRRQREPEKINPAFTLEEIRQLLSAAPRYRPMTYRTYGRGLAGDVRPRHRPDGVRWSVWWEAFVRVGYESGQYLSDLRRVRWCEVGKSGAVSFIRHKTGRALSFRLNAVTLRAASRIQHPDLLLPWQFNMSTYFSREWRKFTTFAGVRQLGAKSLRRSAITYTYIQQGEAAARMLAGHANFTTTARHYIDWSIARRPVIEPPSLELELEIA